MKKLKSYCLHEDITGKVTMQEPDNGEDGLYYNAHDVDDLIEQQQREIEELGVKLLSEEFNQVIDWKDEIKHLHERCERLNKAANEYKQENQALAATVEQLNSIPPLDWRSWGNKARDILEQSPQTNLAEHDAKVARKAFDKGFMCGYNQEECLINPESESADLASQYAKRVKDGE